MRATAALLLLAYAISGCASTSSNRYRTLQEDWQRAGADASPAGAGDEDPFPGAAELARGALVQQVLERNPTARAARYAWRAALARYPQATSLDDPMLGGSIAPGSFGAHGVDEGYRIELSQALPFPGKLALRGQAALGEAEAAARDFAAVRLRLALMASLLYDDYYVAARSVEVNAEHVALLESFQRIAAARYEAGQAAQQDPIQAEVELTHALHDRAVLEATRRIAAEQINALLHRRSSAPLPPPPARAAAADAGAQDPEPLVAQALAERPELAAATARVAAEQARADLARREYWPDFTVSGGYDRFWDERELRPSVGLAMNVPLALGRRSAAVEEADARLEQARSERDALEDEVRLDVERGAERYAETRHVLHLIADRQLPASRDQVEAARAGFESGRNSFLALIDAQRNLRSVELSYEQALADVSRRRAELDRALGRIPGVAW
ncbi:MAG TPA: TolC family protein [Myxococcota bacterium]|nr:TolC family protein [Myxococcota bacterium]